MSGNAARVNFNRGPISHITDAEACTSINFHCLPRSGRGDGCNTLVPYWEEINNSYRVSDL
jgi:hypothetical protein